MELAVESQAREIRQAYRLGANQVSCFLLLPPLHLSLLLTFFSCFSPPLLSSSVYKVQAALKARIFYTSIFLTSGITGMYHYISTFFKYILFMKFKHHQHYIISNLKCPEHGLLLSGRKLNLIII